MLRFNSRRLERLPSAGGMVPVSLLRLRDKSCRLVRLPSSGGIAPLSPLGLPDIFILFEVGSGPFSLNHNSRSWESLPSAAGMVPVRSWLSSFNVRSWVRLPSSAGMVPVRLPPL